MRHNIVNEEVKDLILEFIRNKNIFGNNSTFLGLIADSTLKLTLK